MKCTMGIDVGTSGCKAVVFDDAGGEIAQAYREYDVLAPQPGWAELDSADVMDKCLAVISDAAGQAPPGSVRGLGVTSQGEAFTAIDGNGRFLCNGLVSSDIRAEGYLTTWVEEFGVDRLYQITGHTPHPMHSVFKMLWLRDNNPDVWKKAEKFLCFEDLLQFKLGVDPAISWPLAGRTMLFDVRKHKWSPEILNAAGLAEDKLPRSLPSGSVVGRIERSIARELNLADGAFVVTGGHDQPCGALGAGVTRPGVAMYAMGTVECISPAFREARFTEDLRKHNLCTYDHTLADMYTTVAFSLTGGNILKWFRDELGAAEVAEAQRTGANAYGLLLDAAGDVPSSLLVLPYFTPTGTPYFDAHVTGAVLGLRLTSSRGELIRALLEGVTFEMRLNLEILHRSGCEVDELRAIGGGAKSAAWIQLKADVLGKPITALSVTEAASMGAAMLARAADTGENVAELAANWTRTTGTYEPRKEYVDWYAERFEAYRELYPTLRKMPAYYGSLNRSPDLE